MTIFSILAFMLCKTSRLAIFENVEEARKRSLLAFGSSLPLPDMIESVLAVLVTNRSECSLCLSRLSMAVVPIQSVFRDGLQGKRWDLSGS